MNKKIFLVFLFLILVPMITFFVKKTRTYKGYDSIGGKRVTITNLLRLIEPAPVELRTKVINWFKKYPDAYEVLVEQKGFLTDVGNMILKANIFFHIHKVKNLGNFNYVFQIPNESFFIKIFGPNNRFIYSILQYQIPGVALYLRKVENKINEKLYTYYAYMDFERDKERMRKYFYFCCPQATLKKIPTKKQLKELVLLLAGAFPQTSIRGFVYDCLLEKYIRNAFYPRTVADAFEHMISFAFLAVSHRCYDRQDLVGKTYVDTYNTANRVFYRARFAEAIDRFNLYKLEKPPKSYIINVNPKKPYSCIDKDVILVQYPLTNHRPFKYYLKNQKALYNVFDKEAFKQLLQAMKYAGLWDITGENIQVNSTNNKITYIDFEPKNDILPHELFNKSDNRLKMNLGYLMFEFLKRFKSGTVQREAVEEFILSHKIDFNWYLEQSMKKSKGQIKRGFVFENKIIQTIQYSIEEGPLGKLLYYYDPTSDTCTQLRKEIVQRIKS